MLLHSLYQQHRRGGASLSSSSAASLSSSSVTTMKMTMALMIIILTTTITTTNIIPTIPTVHAVFYIPGVQPTEYKQNEEVQLKVNSLTSTHTQMPRDYYRLPYCRPTNGIQMSSENLGEFLTGNKIQNSPYTIHMLQEMYCTKVCQAPPLNQEMYNRFKLHIKYQYHNNWMIDNLPSATILYTSSTTDSTTTTSTQNKQDEQQQQHKRYAGGFPIGFIDIDTKEPYIYNHVNLFIDYFRVEGTTDADTTYRVVGFAIEPLSIQHQFVGSYKWDGTSIEGMNKPLRTCPSTPNTHITRNDIQQSQKVEKGASILYTYDVIWRSSTIEWSSRWDVYLTEDHLVPAQVHWYSITNSILVVLFLSLLFISILVRNLRRDIAAYNSIPTTLSDEEREEEVDESGWKLIHADVFRPPQHYPMLYCIFLGSGAQLAVTILFAIIFSAIGFLSPARRGSLMNAFLIFYVLTGIVAGYISARIYKAFRGRQWQFCTLLTALFFPGITFTIFVFFNIILWFLHSSASAPFLDVIMVGAMWCCISIPLVFIGAYFGYKTETIEFPTETSTIARAIPTVPLLLNPYVGMILTGIIPFAAAYVELFFIMSSLWMDQFYYVFGFTLIVYIILIITCAEATILLVYYQLCAENHRWWWFSFFASGSTAFYTFIYSIFWFQTLHPSRLLMTYLLYFGYMFIISFGMLLLFGTVGALTSLWFVCKIFSTIKVD